MENKNWQENETDEDISFYCDKYTDYTPKSLFYAFNHKINSKIFIINDDVLNLNQFDALVLQTSKNIFKFSSPYRERILQNCGDLIYEQFKLHDTLCLSDCFITDSFKINNKFSKIVHVVLPKFRSIYQTACESSLHRAVRNVFDICIQNNIKSICFGYEIIKPFEDFPIVLAITIVCRTVRKCLEKFHEKFNKIAFVIEEKELFQKFRETFKMYFPRNKSEECYFSKFLPDIVETEYGDIVNPERNITITTSFSEMKNDSNSNLSPTPVISYNDLYLDKQDDIKNYKIYRNDKQRIIENFLNSNDFSKEFYYKNKKTLTDEMIKTFNEYKYMEYLGLDLLKRQIFKINLEKIDFSSIEDKQWENGFIIHFTELLKMNIVSNERLLILIYSEKLEKKNFPRINLIKIFNKILLSNSVKSQTNLDTHQFVIHLPSFIFKMYIYFLRIYMDKEIWSLIQFCDSESELSQNFCI